MEQIKTISFKDKNLFDFAQEVVNYFKSIGPIDVGFFFTNGEYYLLEINLHSGGAYLYAYGADIDFIKQIDTIYMVKRMNSR